MREDCANNVDDMQTIIAVANHMRLYESGLFIPSNEPGLRNELGLRQADVSIEPDNLECKIFLLRCG